MSENAWKVEGNFHDDVDFEIREAWFGMVEGDERKRIALHLRGVAAQDGEVIDDEYLLRFNVGEGWEPTKKGQAVKHAAGKTLFKGNTGIGRVIAAIVTIDEAREAVAKKGNPTEASTWIGLTLHWEVRQGQFTDRDTKEVRPYDYTIPTDFVGVVGALAKTVAKTDDDEPAEKPARGRGRARAAAVEEVEEAGEVEEAKPPARGRQRARAAKPDNSALRAAVVAFAKEFDEHDYFLECVVDAEMEEDGEVVGFPQAAELAADEELMSDVMDANGSVWTEAQG